jgi:hypothetical protein
MFAALAAFAYSFVSAAFLGVAPRLFLLCLLAINLVFSTYAGTFEGGRNDCRDYLEASEIKNENSPGP